MPKVFFVLGGPGAGKGTQCLKLTQEYDIVHLSAGDLLREERIRQGSQFGDLIEQIIKDGKIVPSEITVSLLENAMIKNGFERTFLIDGFPRNEENLSKWMQLMDSKVDFKGLLYFDCPEVILKERIKKRAEASGRVDDNDDTLIKRLQVYNESTQGIIQYFRSQGKVVEINAGQEVNVVFQQIIATGLF